MIVGVMSLCRFPFYHRCLQSLSRQVDALYLRFDGLRGDPHVLGQLEALCGNRLKRLVVSHEPWTPWNWREEMLRMLDDVQPRLVVNLDEDEEFEADIHDELQDFLESPFPQMLFHYTKPMPTEDGSIVLDGEAYPPEPHVKAYKWRPGLSFADYKSFGNVTQYYGSYYYIAQTRIRHYCLFTAELRRTKLWTTEQKMKVVGQDLRDTLPAQKREAFQQECRRWFRSEESCVILTSYFVSRPDPQHKSIWHSRLGDYNLIRGWYESVMRLGLRAVVFHDGLDSQFVTGVQNAQVQFRLVRRGSMSNNDERYFFFRNFLRDNPGIAKVYLTDLFDVRFCRNPFDVITEEYDLYTGSEPWNQHCMNVRLFQAYGKVVLEPRPVLLNPGIIGGTRTDVLRLLERMTEDMSKVDPEYYPYRDDLNPDRIEQDAVKMQNRVVLGVTLNVNMGVYNKCVHELFPSGRILTGPRLHSEWKKNEGCTDGQYAIIHK